MFRSHQKIHYMFRMCLLELKEVIHEEETKTNNVEHSSHVLISYLSMKETSFESHNF